MRVRLLVSFFFFFTYFSNTFAQSEVATIEKAQALFIYNFSRHIGWPETSFANDEFIIGVVGNRDLFNELVKVTKDKVVGKNKIIVKLYANPEEAIPCHMLVFGDRVKGGAEAYKSKMGNFPSLVINASENSANSPVDISFKMVDQKMNYVLSKNSIKNKGLMISKRLEEMAMSVI